ncbi:MAG: hypothetical protein COW03_00135 [Cytophagales bacterium CG12_big_fil_rev_8_21_14_0_65_40_12]|nr:MAG: hypothetical protein COW03_00135 [Cytophagales bacterium CG12_big_fil_rev_8_21_14_0_65_40_12]PIW04455.1 MAG: hypothetical protein COW40_09695 [Cytophagales bacterium CG17_big_fil_post_rev_8_21_14_2_50_40_13]
MKSLSLEKMEKVNGGQAGTVCDLECYCNSSLELIWNNYEDNDLWNDFRDHIFELCPITLA